jgi:hypothetical protein
MSLWGSVMIWGFMKTIYKYQLAQKDYQTLILPVGAEILTVQEQITSGLCIWAIVPTKQL